MVFRYEVMWERHDGFTPLLEQAWKGPGKAASLVKLQE